MRRTISRGIAVIEIIAIAAAISIVGAGTGLALTDKGPDAAERGRAAAVLWAQARHITPTSIACELDYDADGYSKCLMQDARLSYVLQCATGLKPVTGCKVMEVRP